MNGWDLLLEDDDHAATYMMTYGEGPGCPTRMMLTKLINDGESVLDIGCGPGWNFDHFMQYGPAISNYKGLDYSERFVRVANDRAMQLAETASGPYELGDVRNPKQPDSSWDVVILQDVLEHTNGYKKPVKKALKIARKRVIVSFWHLTENDDHINDDGDDMYGAWYSKPKWEAFLDSLDLHWAHDEVEDNKVRDFYIIDKQEPHGKRTPTSNNRRTATTRDDKDNS